MDTFLQYLPLIGVGLALLLALLATFGFLQGLYRSWAGRANALLSIMIWVFALFTAALGFGVGGVGPEFPGWRGIGLLAHALLYIVPAVLLALTLQRGRWPSFTWLSLGLYGVLTALAGFMGTVSGFREDSITPLLVALTGFLATSLIPRERILLSIRTALMALCVGSLLYLVGAFGWATSDPGAADSLYSSDYSSLIGLSFRLHGLSTHGNALGLIAGAALVLGLYRPLRYRQEWLWQGAALLTLIFSQSKTVWIALAVALAVRAVSRVWSLPPMKRALSLTVLLTGIGMGVAALTLYAPQTSADEITFTGRTALWRVTMQEYQANTLAGYGPHLWDEQYRLQNGFPWAGQAHSQYIQALGQAGMIGGFGLVLLIAALVLASWRSRHMTQGASLALTTLFLLRSASESTLLLGQDAIALIILATWLMATAHEDHFVHERIPLNRSNLALRTQGVVQWKKLV